MELYKKFFKFYTKNVSKAYPQNNETFDYLKKLNVLKINR